MLRRPSSAQLPVFDFHLLLSRTRPVPNLLLLACQRYGLKGSRAAERAGAGAVGAAGTLRELQEADAGLCRRNSLPVASDADFYRVCEALESESLIGIEKLHAQGWATKQGVRRMSAGGVGCANTTAIRKYHLKVDLGDVRYGLQGVAALARILEREVPAEGPEEARGSGAAGAGADASK